MLVPFREDTLDQVRFIRDELQFNLLYTISGGERAVALQTEDGAAVALANPGRNMWLWIDPGMGEQYAASVINGLVEKLREINPPGIVSTPESATAFAKAYCHKSGAQRKQSLDLMAYSCPAVKMPSGVPGRMERAGEEHAETVADFMQGFQMDCFHTEANRKETLGFAVGKIRQGNLFLWNADGKTVCMAAVAHRSVRHARIGYVYTPPKQRKKGYAGALVAALSKTVLDEGLTPMLYADMANPTSNKVYRGIGYIEAGPVREIGFNY